MKRRPTEQDQAHELLLEWSAGLEAANGGSYPAMPVSAPVQGARPEMSSPERFAWQFRRHAKLDRAFRRVKDTDPILQGVLRQMYERGRVDERAMADEHKVSLRTWRRWRDAARIAFLREFKALDGAVSID